MQNQLQIYVEVQLFGLCLSVSNRQIFAKLFVTRISISTVQISILPRKICLNKSIKFTSLHWPLIYFQFVQSSYNARHKHLMKKESYENITYLFLK